MVKQLLKVAVAAVAMVGGSAFATAVTANLAVSATVNPGCSISTNPVAFGTYAPLSTHASTPANASGTVNVQCTLGTVAVVTLGQGSSANTGSTDSSPLRRLTDGASHYLSYALYSDATHLVPWANTALTGVAHVGLGTSLGVTVYGVLAAGQVVPSGGYTDTVVATITF